MQPRRTISPSLITVFAVVGALLGLFAPAAARASGSPDLALTADADATVLYGLDSGVRLTATNPAPGIDGDNLSYRVVLPFGIAYRAGSAGAVAGEPQRLANAPGAGQTTLLWKNVADLSPGSSHTLAFVVVHNPASIILGASFPINAGAYVSDNSRYVPTFDAAGQPVTTGAHPYTGSATASDSTQITGIAVENSSSAAPEGELLRGVHDHQSLYTVTLTNNHLAPTTQPLVDDYLPPSLEFLGCGGAGADHTTDAPTNAVPGSPQEYPGAGPITVAAVPSCIAPTLVETITVDPPGPAPLGLYTHVQWSGLPTLAIDSVTTLQFRAAIPLRANTLTWPSGTPATSGAQAANLDNNSGPETADEANITSYVRASGIFNNTDGVTTGTSLTRTAEDLAIQKSGSTQALAQGGLTTWTLDVSTSEYRSADHVVVTDTVPDGLCPLSASANLAHAPQAGSDAVDCAVGADPSAPYATAQEQADGTWTVAWDETPGSDPALAQLGPSQTHQLTFTTRTRASYQAGYADAAPVLAGDVATNQVAATADARVICGPATACAAGGPFGTELDHDGPLTQAIGDASSAAVTAASPTLDQRVAQTSVDCSTATYVDASPTPPTWPSYGPGDRVCWKLRVDYPGSVATAGVQLVDFLQAGLLFDTAFGTAGDQPTGADTIGGATFDSSGGIPGPGGEVRWTLPATLTGTQVFEHRIATRVQLPAGSVPGDLAPNLFKSSTADSAGLTAPLRDEANIQLSMPVLTTQKRITAVDGGAVGGSTGVATAAIRGGQTVDFRVRLANLGDRAAEAVEAWDRLPAALTCADVVGASISDGGVCSGGVIRWGATPAIGPTIVATSTKDLTYQVLFPTTVEPTQALTNAAGIRQFQTPTNTGGAFTYIPGSNIDPSQDPSANVVSATSSATMTGAVPTVTKVAHTLTTEGAFNTDATATIGEIVRYSVDVTMPAGITVRDLDVTDVIDPSRQAFVPASVVQTAGPAPASLAFSGGAVTLALASTYTAPTGADTTYSFDFDTTVVDATTNFRLGAPLTNTAALLYTPPGTVSGGARTTITSNQTSLPIVEPDLSISKTADVGSSPVIGGQVVEYTVLVTNNLGSSSPAHETGLVDVVPTGVTPLNTLGNAIADGESTLGGGVWSAGARTLTFAPNATINPGTNQSFVYRVRVNDPAIGGISLTNTATARTSNLAGAAAGERATGSPRTTGYITTIANTLSVQTASVSKSVADATLTPGDKTVYTLDVTIPAGTIHFDTTVRDTLQDSLDFDGPLTATCVSGCAAGPTTPTIQAYTPVVNGNGTTTAAWDLGDLSTSAPTPRLIRITYAAHLRTTHRSGGAPVVRTQTAQNSVIVASNRTDQLGAFAAGSIPGGPFDDASVASTRTVTTIEPVLGLDKRIAVNAGAFLNGPSIVRDGDALHYRITVTNAGDAPAYDVAVNDLPNAALTAVTPIAGLSTTANTDPWAAPGDNVGWVIPGPIAAGGGTAVLEYTAALPDVTTTHDADQFDNTAQVTSAYGLPLATRLADGFSYRSYTTATDTTRAIYDSPTLTVAKTTGTGSGPGYPESAGVQIGQSFPWRVTVTNTSATESATSLTVRDVLPPNWVFDTGSASFAPGGAAVPSIVSQPTGDVLTWSTGLTLLPGASTVLSYQAHPTLAAATTPGIGAGHPHVNTAGATASNGAGHPADAAGPFTGADDTASAILTIPAVLIAATPDAGTAAAGTTIPFHLVVTNTGAVSATNVVVTDPFPASLTYTPGSATASPSTGFTESAATASSATWTIASLAAGASVDLTVPLASDPTSASGTLLTNTATVNSDQSVNAVSDDATVTLTTRADLAASKSASPNPATAGQTLTYTLGATNSGPSVASGVVLTDPLPSTVTFVSASAGCVYSAGPRTVTCTYPGATAVGASRTATITTTVVPGTTTNADNTATASSATVDPASGNDAATASVPVGARADLRLTKSAAASTVLHGALIGFDLHVNNAGPSNATAAQVVDTLPAGLAYVSDDGGCSAAGQVITCPIGMFASGANRTVHVVARGTTLGAQMNSATVSSATVDPVAGNETGTATVTVDPATDLSMTLTGPSTVPAGGELTYTLTASNAGPDDATGVQVVATLPPGTSFVSGDGGCTAAGSTVTCAVGGLPSGSSASRQITVQAGVSLGATAITANAAVQGVQGDPTPSANAASSSAQVGPAANVSLTSDAPSSATGGGSTTFTLVARNDGPSDAPTTVVTAQLPPGVTLDQVSTSQGSCTAAGAVLTCDLGTLTSGTSTLITITVKVPPSLIGTGLSTSALIRSGVPDPDESNGTSTRPTTVLAPPPVVPKADLALSKVADGVARAGERLTYTITATNHGPSAAQDVVVHDALVGGVAYRSARTSSGDCSFAKGTIRCTLGTLANGESAQIRVAVVPDKRGIIVNNAVVDSDTSDPVPADNRAVAKNTVPQQGPTTLSLTKTLPTKRVKGGQRLTYTLRVRNTGKVVATMVRVCDRLPIQLAFTSTRGGVLDGARLCFTAKSLKRGQQAVYRVLVRVQERSKQGAFINKASAVADNAASVTATAAATVITDGKVSAEQVHGFTG